MADLFLSRTCCSCKVAKPLSLEYFYGQKDNRCGFGHRCRDCAKAASVAQRERRRAKRLLECPPPPAGLRLCRTCKVTRPECDFRLWSVRGRTGPSNVCNDCVRVRARAQGRRSWLRHREQRIAAAREYRANNKDKASQAVKRWKQAHPEAAKPATAKRRAMIANVGGTFTKGDVLALHKRQSGCCFYCAVQLDKYHVDHFIPISRGGDNWPSNLVLACEPCNYDKRAKLPWEWKPDRFAVGCAPWPNTQEEAA